MPIIDMHAHIGNFDGFVSGGEKTIDQLVELWDASEIEKGVISILDGVDIKGANDQALAACAHHPGRVFAYIYLNPTRLEDSLRELERRQGDERFVGIKLHPANDVYFPFLDDYAPLYERIEKSGLPTLWHSGTYPFSGPLQIAAVARRFPGSVHILGHFGIAEMSWECDPSAALADNIVVDTSINPIIPLINDFIEKYGAERVLWGSDWPFYHVEYERLKVQFLGHSAADRERIIGGNAQRILRFPE